MHSEDNDDVCSLQVANAPMCLGGIQICTHTHDECHVTPVQWFLQSLHAPSLLAYAEQHRWVCGGMGAASLATELRVGGPIAIQRTST